MPHQRQRSLSLISSEEVVQLKLHKGNEIFVFGMKYYKVEVENDDAVPWSSICKDVTRIGFAILLPVLLQDSAEKVGMGHFALVSSNWKTFGESANTLSEMIESSDR